MQLYINGKEITLTPDAKIALTLQLNNLGDISKPNTSFTNSFKIRKLAENVRAFEYLGIAGNSSRIQYKLNNATLLENNIPLLLNGYCEIRDTSAYEYDINIYGTEKSFFTRLKNLSLRDTYPNTFIGYTSQNLATYVNQLSNFTFPSVAQYNGESIHSGPNFQGSQRTSQTSTLHSTPHFFVKGLFDGIFSYLGYSVEYPMVADPVFRRLVIPAGRGLVA